MYFYRACIAGTLRATATGTVDVTDLSSNYAHPQTIKDLPHDLLTILQNLSS